MRSSMEKMSQGKRDLLQKSLRAWHQKNLQADVFAFDLGPEDKNMLLATIEDEASEAHKATADSSMNWAAKLGLGDDYNSRVQTFTEPLVKGFLRSFQGQKEPTQEHIVGMLSTLSAEAKAIFKSHFLQNLNMNYLWASRMSKGRVRPVNILRSPSVAQEVSLMNLTAAVALPYDFEKPLFNSEGDVLPDDVLVDLERWLLAPLCAPSHPVGNVNVIQSAVSWLYGHDGDPAETPMMPRLPLAITLQAMVGTMISAPTPAGPVVIENVNQLISQERPDSLSGFFCMDARKHLSPDIKSQVMSRLAGAYAVVNTWVEPEPSDEAPAHKDDVAESGLIIGGSTSTTPTKPAPNKAVINAASAQKSIKLSVQNFLKRQPAESINSPQIREDRLGYFKDSPLYALSDAVFDASTRAGLWGPEFSNDERVDIIFQAIQETCDSLMALGLQAWGAAFWANSYAYGIFRNESFTSSLRDGKNIKAAVAKFGKKMGELTANLVEMGNHRITENSEDVDDDQRRAVVDLRHMIDLETYRKGYYRSFLEALTPFNEPAMREAVSRSIDRIDWLCGTAQKDDQGFYFSPESFSEQVEFEKEIHDDLCVDRRRASTIMNFIGHEETHQIASGKNNHGNCPLFWGWVREHLSGENVNHDQEIMDLWRALRVWGPYDFDRVDGSKDSLVKWLNAVSKWFNDGPNDLRERIFALANQQILMDDKRPKMDLLYVDRLTNSGSPAVKDLNAPLTPLTDPYESWSVRDFLAFLLYASLPDLTRDGPNSRRHARLTQALPISAEGGLMDWIENSEAPFREREDGKPIRLFRRYFDNDEFNLACKLEDESWETTEIDARCANIIDRVESLWCHENPQISWVAQRMVDKLMALPRQFHKPLLNPLLKRLASSSAKTQDHKNPILVTGHIQPDGFRSLDTLSLKEKNSSPSHFRWHSWANSGLPVADSMETIRLATQVDLARGFKTEFAVTIADEDGTPIADIDLITQSLIVRKGINARNESVLNSPYILDPQMRQEIYALAVQKVKSDYEYATAMADSHYKTLKNLKKTDAGFYYDPWVVNHIHYAIKTLAKLKIENKEGKGMAGETEAQKAMAALSFGIGSRNSPQTTRTRNMKGL